MYCIKYENTIKPYFGFIRPYNSVADGETYSLTYLPPSLINGLEKALDLKGKIMRHKLTYYPNEMAREQVKIPIPNSSSDATQTVYIKNYLINPTLILGFELYEDALNALKLPLHLGQSEYVIYPNEVFSDDFDSSIVELNDEEFSALLGVETFELDGDSDDAIFCGFNRLKDNKRMFISIDRKEWTI